MRGTIESGKLQMIFHMEEIRKKKYTPGIALQKIQSYCAYQERCHSEVREKLYSWGLYKKDVEQIIVQLIQDNYLNEERFAIAYASGKFRIKKWGKNKIKQALKARHISDYCIRKAMKEIESDDYEETLKKLVEKKAKSVKEKKLPVRRYKVAQYLILRGYEPDAVWTTVNEIMQ